MSNASDNKRFIVNHYVSTKVDQRTGEPNAPLPENMGKSEIALNLHQGAETLFVKNDNGEIVATPLGPRALAEEDARAKAEALRIKAEQSRTLAEGNRTNAEDARTKAEQSRVEAEQARVEAEQERAIEFAGFAQDINKGSIRLLDLQWEQAGGSVIVSGETYGLNGINDLSLSEAIDILAQYANATILRSSMANTFQNSKLRTTFPLRIGASYTCNIMGMFSGSTKLEKLAISGLANIKPMPNAFQGCSSLRKIDGTLYVRDCSTVSDFANAFKGCATLEDVRISQLKYDISFADSPLLSLGSISSLIAQRAGSNTITVTVHPDVYAKLTGDTTNAAAAALSADELAQWQEVLGQAVAKNISFATA